MAHQRSLSASTTVLRSSRRNDQSVRRVALFNSGFLCRGCSTPIRKDETPVGLLSSTTVSIRRKRAMHGASVCVVDVATCSPATFNTNGTSGSRLLTKRVTTERVRMLARGCCRCFAGSRATLRTTFARSLRPSFRFDSSESDIMNYDEVVVSELEVPQASARIFQHLVKTYASEINKLNSVWHEFAEEDLAFKPHPRSTTVREIMEHELLSERRFFAEFLGLPEVPANEVLPQERTPRSFAARMVELSRARLQFLANQDEEWWLAVVPFFDVERERLWIFWRRVLHTAHHRAQLGVYLRLLNKTVPSTYGPTADVRWKGADPTRSVAAASRK